MPSSRVQVLFATVVGVVASGSFTSIAARPEHVLSLTLAATGIIVCAIACAGMAIYTALRTALRADIHAIVDDRMQRIEGNTRRIAAVEHEVLQEMRHRNSDRYLN